MDRVSVILPMYNEPFDIIRKVVSGWQNQDYKNLEIVVVDNSDDRRFKWLDSKKKIKYFYVKNPVRLPGYPKRVGAYRSSGKLLLFSDADSVPMSNDVISKMVKKGKNVIGYVCDIDLGLKMPWLAEFCMVERDKYFETGGHSAVLFGDDVHFLTSLDELGITLEVVSEAKVLHYALGWKGARSNVDHRCMVMGMATAEWDFLAKKGFIWGIGKMLRDFWKEGSTFGFRDYVFEIIGYLRRFLSVLGVGKWF